MEQTIAEAIKNSLAEQIDKEYTEYKNKCLEELNLKIELKRNEVISTVLNNIAINLSNDEMSLNPVINIRIETRPIIKM